MDETVTVVTERPFAAVPVHRARMAKADALADVVRALRIPTAALRAYGTDEWAMVAGLADVRMPSPTTCELVREWVAATEQQLPPPDDSETA